MPDTSQDLDRHEPQHVDFWQAMALVAEHELQEAERQEEIDRARVRGEEPPPHLTRREAGWHASIDADVSAMLAGAAFCCLPCIWHVEQSHLDSGRVSPVPCCDGD